MNLGSMLHELTVGILRDTAEPRLWSDTILTEYLNDAVRQFVLSTGSEVQSFDATLAAGGSTATLPSQVLRVDRVYRGRSPLRRSLQPFVDRSGEQPTHYFVENDNTIQFNATPTSPVVITVHAIPKPRPMQSQLDVPDGVDELWHRALLYYAAWMAFTESDVEGMNTQMAESYYRKWVLEVSRARGYNWKRRGGPVMTATSNARFN